MLFHSNAPLFLWVEAFTTAVYLMNRLPSSTLNFESPYFMLHGNHPTYSSLRVFGSKCFPYTWDTKQNKFDPKTILCIFVGFSDKHKGYKCFHPPSKKMLISRHVVFDESSFPYKQKLQNYITSSPTHVMSIFDSWLPPAISKFVADIQPVMSTPPCLSSLPHTLSSSLPLHDDYAITNTIAEQHVSANNVTGTQLAEYNNENGMVELHLPPSQSESTSLSHITENTSNNPSVFTTATTEQHLNDDNTIEIQLVESDNENDTQLQQLSPSPSNSALLESDTQLVHSPFDPPLSHTMVTRSHRGILKPNPKYALTSLKSFTTIPREPSNFRSALAHPGWKAAMEEELEALHRNHTWELVPRTKAMHVIGSKWVLKTKLKPDGSLDRLKARLVAKGYHQIDGLDYTETYSLVIKPGTIRMVISIALVHKWSIRQLDVKNVFLHGFVSEDIYMEQPPGAADPQYPSHVCKLRKALYGLKQAPRAWFDRFSIFLLQYGFFCSLADPSLFIFHSNSDTLILLLYVHDILLTGSFAPLVTNLIQLLSFEFAMKDLGPIHHFLGIEITQTLEGLHLSQSHYALTILERAGMVDCKPMSTPLEAKTKTAATDILLQDP
jgi:hypothetical protein